MYELVIFDMDGVLVNSEKTFKKACADALHRWGVFPEYDEFTPYTGMGDVPYIGEVAKAHGTPFDPEMVTVAYKLYGEYAKQTLSVFPWSRKVLEALHQAGIPICIASSAGIFKVHTNLDCIGVSYDIFETIVSGDEVENKKPDPAIFLHAAKKCGVDPAKCLVFEDAISGVTAAKAAGMTACAVTTSFCEEKLRGAKADIICTDVFEAAKEIFSLK